MKILLLTLCTLFLFGCEGGSSEGANEATREQGGGYDHSTDLIRDPVGTVFVDIDLNQQTVTLKNKTFRVEIADSPAERRIGLMNRKNLGEETGMLFIFEQSEVYPFWMKNTLIPLTMVWIAEDRSIVDIQDAVPCKEDPCKNYVPSGKARYVLEVNRGALDDETKRDFDNFKKQVYKVN